MAVSRKPATTPEERENICIALAMDCAEEQLRNGTASSQVITHFLSLASSKERLAQEIKEKEKELLVAKTENLQSNTKLEQTYMEAIEAMKTYSGNEEVYEEYEEEDDDDD